MSVIVDVAVPTESFTFEETLTAAPNMTVEAERVASHSPEWALPFIWASGGDFEAFDGAMQDDPTVEDATEIETVDGDALYKIQWSEGVLELITEMINRHAIILEARTRDEKWRLNLRFADEEQVSPFMEHFSEQGHQFQINRLYHPKTPRQREYGLTADQYETLVTAFQKGYFDVPRGLSMEELADGLEISSNSVSQRIRRGSANLIQHTLTIGAAESSDGE